VTGTVHVVGAGLAGLAAAVRLAKAGRRVVLHEAAKQAGGRCRSYHDTTLGLTIDNGNHLLLSGNHAALAYVRRIGGEAALGGPGEARFHFIDLRDGTRWGLRLGESRLPWWILDPGRRVPGTAAREYLAPLRLFRAGPGMKVSEAMACRGRLYERLWQPLLVAGLNTDPPEASARLAAALLRETLGAGGAACRPIIASGGLSAAFVDPALALLASRGADIRFGARLRAVEATQDVATHLHFADGSIALSLQDRVVLAAPPPVAAGLLPGLRVPTAFRAIVNAHFRVPPPAGLPPLTGIVGGLAEWLFAYPDRLSVTISAADRLLERRREDLAGTIWAEVARVAGLASHLPPWQIVTVKRATFAATPDEERRRPGTRTRLRNLVLAGDWTATGLPATIEGAIRSGDAAAEAIGAPGDMP
jgi:squalene-associated FAD-dependent desaturase